MAEPDTIQPALVLGVLGIFIAATGVISLAFHNLGRACVTRCARWIRGCGMTSPGWRTP